MTSSSYRWVIVAAGGLLGCVAIGSMFSLPVLLRPIAHDTGWSATGVSSAMTVGFLVKSSLYALSSRLSLSRSPAGSSEAASIRIKMVRVRWM